MRAPPVRVSMTAAALLLPLILLTGCLSSDPPMLVACEEAIKDRLQAPSTYRRISITWATSPVPLETYLLQERSDAVKTFYRGMKPPPQPAKIRALIAYDAANAYGTPLRNTADCTYTTMSPDKLDGINKHIVDIDGKSFTDYLAESLRPAPRR